jgi:predicted DsbA family dithiol-disulfide isomerase
MLITLYKSAFCPRCYLARKYLHEIIASKPEIQVIEVDILTAPRQSWNDGIRMIPALKIDERVLSALFMSKTNIADFIARRLSENRHFFSDQGISEK